MSTTREINYDVVFDAQQDFRKIMDVMARPGKIVQLKKDNMEINSNLNSGGCLIAFALLNADVSFFAEHNWELESFLTVNTSCAPTELEKADYLFVSGQSAHKYVENAKEGVLEYPENSATIIINTEKVSESPLDDSELITLDGPGVDGKKEVYIKGTSRDFFEAILEKNSEYPLGVDTFITDQEGNIMAIPRTNKLQLKNF